MGSTTTSMTSEEFRTIRLQLGLTQAELADLMGTYAQHISRIERGDRGPTRLQSAFIRHIAAAIMTKIRREK